jgi:hypothetical protein
MEIAYSVNGVPIRLTAERWWHIVMARDDLAGRMDEVLAVVERPDWVTRSHRGSLRAWKGHGRKGYLVVVYKELGKEDGFVITSFFTRQSKKRNKVWPK